MSDVGPVGTTKINPMRGAVRPDPQTPSAPRTVRPDDKVELSLKARLLSKLAELPDVRQDLVDRVRAEIQAGTYDTPDKIDAIIDELALDL